MQNDLRRFFQEKTTKKLSREGLFALKAGVACLAGGTLSLAFRTAMLDVCQSMPPAFFEHHPLTLVFAAVSYDVLGAFAGAGITTTPFAFCLSANRYRLARKSGKAGSPSAS